LLILRTLAVQPMHGYGIAQHVGRLSENVFRVEQGSLYPALDRLLRQGFATAKWGVSSTGRKARHYTITAKGRKELGERITRLERLNAAIQRVLREA
jgi:transcriptional regulator